MRHQVIIGAGGPAFGRGNCCVATGPTPRRGNGRRVCAIIGRGILPLSKKMWEA